MSDTGYGLADNIAVVTGAGGGIGRAIAEAFAAEGARVAVLDVNEAGTQETAGMISARGQAALPVTCNVAEDASVEAANAAIAAEWGAADILVNCAAVQRRGPLATLGSDDWDNAMAVNLKGYFICSRVFGRAMRERRKGVLVHVSSVQALFPSPNAGAYSAAKAGVSMLSKQLAVEWGPEGVRSNAVLPAWVITPLSQKIYDNAEFKAMRESVVPLRRIGSPEDTAQAVLFLASDRAGYISGAELMIDGAMSNNLMGSLPRPT